MSTGGKAENEENMTMKPMAVGQNDLRFREDSSGYHLITSLGLQVKIKLGFNHSLRLFSFSLGFEFHHDTK